MTMRNACGPFDGPRAAALALLNGSENWSPKTARFLGQMAAIQWPLTFRQRNWLEGLLEEAGLPPLAEGGEE